MYLFNKSRKVLTVLINTVFLSVNILPLYAQTEITSTQRSLSTVKDMRESSAPSNLSIAGTQDFFDEHNAILVDQFDLSAYKGKKIFAGYGIYDHKEDHCKFVEQPGATKQDYIASFSIVKNFNEHSYGLSQEKMTYRECKNLSDKLGGVPLVVDSEAEGAFITSSFGKYKISSNERVGKIWLGIYNADAGFGYHDEQGIGYPLDSFVNEYGNNHKYLNLRPLSGVECDPIFSQVYAGNSSCSQESNSGRQYSDYLTLDINGEFVRTDENEKHYCAIEFQSKNMFKPIKICAPWWKVIREYKTEDDKKLYDSAMLNRINQADIPVQMPICTKYNKEAQQQLSMPSATRIAHCTEYYSRTIAPECANNPKQAICKVDECKGYINNACKLIRKDTVGKGYVKGDILIKGKHTESKVKTDVITKEFVCPASPPSNSMCVESSVVMIYPKECPGSSCEALKTCVYSAGSDKKKIDDCYVVNTCNKIYGSRDIPPKVENGEVTALYGKCPDNTILEFPVNIEKKIDKQCLEYEMITKNLEEVQRCVADRQFFVEEANASITGADPFQEDPNCIRLDTATQTLKASDVVVKVNLKGFFKHKVTRVNLDETTEVAINMDGPEYDKYTVSAALSKLVSATGGIVDVSSKEKTEIFGDDSKKNICQAIEQWEARNIALMEVGASTTLDNVTGETIDVEGNETGIREVFYLGGDPYVKLNGNVSSIADCDTLAQDKGFKTQTTSTAFLGNGTCQYAVVKTGFDSDIGNITRGGEDSVQYVMKDPLTKSSCMEKAYCLDGIYNERDFADEDTKAQCIITHDEQGTSPRYETEIFGDSPEGEYISYGDHFLGDPAEILPVESVAKTIKVQANSTIEQDVSSTANMIVFEDYLSGGFGYYSNHNSKNPISNIISVTTGEFIEKNMYFDEISKIEDLIHYHAVLHHLSWKAKKPNVVASIVSGATTTAAFAAAVAVEILAAIPIWGWIAIVVIMIVSLFVGKAKTMDQQRTSYHIYKDIPNKYMLTGMYESRLSSTMIHKDEQGVSDFLAANGIAVHLADEQKTKEISHLSGNPEPFGYTRMTYSRTDSDTGRDKPGRMGELLSKVYEIKRDSLIELGFDEQEIERMQHNWEKVASPHGHPSCKWYKPNCKKSDNHHAEVVTNKWPALPEHFVDMPNINPISTNPIDKEKMQKTLSTVYLGAVNTLAILVQFIGDYEVIAYDKYGNELSRVTIHEDDFNSGIDPLGLKTAQVNFGLNMQLAVDTQPINATSGNTTSTILTNACVEDKSVEWGGGVSGTFYENQRTDESQRCVKSNDIYVKDKSMAKISVKPLNSQRAFIYTLTSPMPYPNRIRIATVGNLEKRTYRCYKDFNACADDDYKADNK